MRILTINMKPVIGRLSFFSGRVKFSLSMLLLASTLHFFSSCSDDDDPRKPVLVQATQLLTRSASELQTFLSFSSIDIDPSTIQYDVVIYKVTYQTEYKGSSITASGIVVLPETDDQIGMVSFQHGTIASQAEAPSNLPLNNTQLILYAALSSTGFITVVPDFIGFGESNEVFHPYYVEEATSRAVVDNIQAARELAAQNDVNFNQKLFLAGYSQGGYATMATHKFIEENALSGFDLVASFPASGGYDVKGVQEYFFAQDTYSDPFYIAFVAQSYKSFYDWNTPLSDFFQEPYATSIPSLFNGTNTAGTINANLTDIIPDLLQPHMLANIDTDPKYADLVTAFNENSLLDWTPSIPMYMYHGDADITVPYQNSVDTYNHFLSQGASASVVTFTTLPGADHGGGVVPYVEDFFEKLILLK
jgi:pimeloyl-ACP methyl ester carboxylesterase